jgi:pimeloyl-ACP methyl ester carboxylesterase
LIIVLSWSAKGTPESLIIFRRNSAIASNLAQMFHFRKRLKRIIAYFFLACCLFFILFSILYYRKDIPVEQLMIKYGGRNSQFLNLMGMQVHYRIEGRMDDSVPLVLLHGTSSSLQTWDSLVRRLSEEKKIIRMDLPGFGLTGPNPDNDYSFGFYIRFLDSFLNRLEVHRCILAGNSLGGGIAWQFALEHPGRISKLILLDATGFPLKNRNAALGFRLIRIPVVQDLARHITPKFVAKYTLESLYADKMKVTDPLVQRYYDMTLRVGNREAMVERIRIGYDQEYQRIPGLDLPTLIIWGENDPLLPAEDAHLFQRAIKGSRLVVIPHTGHMPMEESPDKVAKAILEFL